MKNKLDHILETIETKYNPSILKNARNYLEIEIGKVAAKLGYHDLKKRYAGVHAVVPLKEAVQGMKVRIDGRTFVDYVQFESGIAIPGYIASDSQRLRQKYVPNDSMILNFS
jgi:hypothetical protein